MADPSTSSDKQHITCHPDVLGGKPCIAGSRIGVQDICIWHELQGQSADEIVASFPQLTHADVYAALAYFWDHRDAILADIRRGDAVIEQVRAGYQPRLAPRTATGS